jgi:hypothetical protein
MPTLLEHVAITGFVALAVVKKPKWALLLCWVAILPDLDIFLGLHRMVFHSLLILVPLSLAILGITYGWFPRFKEPAFIIVFALLSHTLLDWLQYWNALLWPLPFAFWLNITIAILPTSPIPTPLLLVGPMIAPLEVLTVPTTGTLVGPLDAGLFLLFLIVATFRIWPHVYYRFTSPARTADTARDSASPTEIVPLFKSIEHHAVACSKV